MSEFQLHQSLIGDWLRLVLIKHVSVDDFADSALAERTLIRALIGPFLDAVVAVNVLAAVYLDLLHNKHVFHTN